MLHRHCIYCEKEGRKTELIRVDHWGVCPIHSADWLRKVGRHPDQQQETHAASAA